MDENKDIKLNNDNTEEQTGISGVSQESLDTFEEIMAGFYDLTRAYAVSDGEESSKEKELREKEEKRRALEMEAIREDIERRYSKHLEDAQRNAESGTTSLSEKEKQAENLSREIVRDELDRLDSILEESPVKEKAEKAVFAEKPKKAKKVKKAPKQRKERNREVPTINLDETNILYSVIYSFGDSITKTVFSLLGFIIHLISIPIKKLHMIVDDLTSEIKEQSRENIGAILVETAKFRQEVRRAKSGILSALKHPLSVPKVLFRYFRLAQKRHHYLLKTAVNIALPVLSVIILAVVVNYWNHLTFALEVIYNDNSIGYISDESVFIEARDMVLNQLSAGSSDVEVTKAASGNLNAGYKLSLVSLDELDDAKVISDKMIKNSVDNLTNACGIYIDGNFICAVKNESDAKTVFYNILEPYEKRASEEGYVVGFAEDIDYIQGLYRDDESVMWDASKLEDTVLGRDGATSTYTVKDGDTLESIAVQFSSTMDEISSLNGNMSDLGLTTGTSIVVPSNKIMVRIKKTVSTSEVRTVEFDTVTTHDVTKYSGYREVRQTGMDGTERVTTTRIYIDGELSETTYDYETIIAPVEEIVVVGTKTTYGGVYIGSASSKGFLWPAPHCHYISSPYGWRSSGWHKGIDLCTGNGTAYGSRVIASRAGTVELIQRSSSGYGHMVLINHGDGYKTRYAHMVAGSICVSMGQRVEAGQTIGKVGSTGNSSGPHLHFEVIYNGENQNPTKYLY